jgi:alpha-tubulin suppressor-like RCC1 family protein
MNLLLCPRAVALDAVFNGPGDVPVVASSYVAAGNEVSFSLNFQPETGTSLTVIRITGTGFVDGEFANLPHGAQVRLHHSGRQYIFLANYHGNGGRDLVLQWANVKPVAWGDGLTGQLGTILPDDAWQPEPLRATGAWWGKTPFSGAAGGGHSLGLASDGSIIAWGLNSYGQLGIGSITASSEPTAVTLPANRKAIAVAAGANHSLALASDGTLLAWGRNSSGQLGNNSTTQSTVPVAVTSSGVLSGRTVVAIAAGGAHSLALCSDGKVAAWGYNTYGQLGNNSTTASSVPVVVTYSSGALAGKSVVAIAAGANHSLALCSDGTVVAWGRNANGQLGNNSTNQSNIPVAVTTNSGALVNKTVVWIAAGGSHSLALCNDSSIAAWGLNSSGQLGNGTTTESTTPVAVVASGVLQGKSVIMVAAGSAHSLAQCTDGTVAAWGTNSNGELGDNTNNNRNAPVAVATSAWPEGSIRGFASGSSASHNLGLFAAPQIDLNHVGIHKVLQYNQSSNDEPILDPDTPFAFMSSVQGGPMGELLASSTLTPPLGASGGSLYEKGNPGLQLMFWGRTKALMDAACPPGSYLLKIQTSVPNTYEVGITLGPDNYPGIPRITHATNATWQNLVLKVTDPTQPVTLTWANAFSDYASFQIENTPISSPGGEIITQFTIPGNSLQEDTRFRATIRLFRGTMGVPVPGAPDAYASSDYNIDVRFIIEVGTPLSEDPPMYLLTKNHNQVQTSNAGPVDFPNPLPDADLAPYSMAVESPVGGTMAGPAGTSVPLSFACDVDDAQFIFYSAAYPDLPAFNAARPNGDYTFPDDVTLSLPADAYPETARILSVNGAPPVWNAQGQLALDPSIDNTIEWSGVIVPDFETAGYQEVEFESFMDFNMPELVEERGFMAVETTPITSFVVPKFSFTPTYTYMGNIKYASLSSINEPEPGVFAVGAYQTANQFMIVALKPQVMVFDPPPPRTYPSGPFALEGSASSGLPLTYEVTNGPATIEGSTVTLVGTGTVTIRASQGGNGVYASVASITRSFEVTASGGGTALANFRTTQGLAADGSEDLLTPANDGVPNLLKFAFNMIGTDDGQAPTLDVPNVRILGESGVAGLPRPGNSSGRLTITYIRRKAVSNPGISYAVEFSGTLGVGSWDINQDAHESTVPIDATFERVTVTDSAAFDTRFARVRVK